MLSLSLPSLLCSCAGIYEFAILHIPDDVACANPSDGHGTRWSLCAGHDHLVCFIAAVWMGVLQDSYYHAICYFPGVWKHDVHCSLDRPVHLGVLQTRQVDMGRPSCLIFYTITMHYACVIAFFPTRSGIEHEAKLYSI